jgi:hypothetical protein
MTFIELRTAIGTAAEELRTGERSHTDVANWLLDLDARLRAEVTCDGCGDGSWGFEMRVIPGCGDGPLKCCRRCGKAQNPGQKEENQGG